MGYARQYARQHAGQYARQHARQYARQYARQHARRYARQYAGQYATKYGEHAGYDAADAITNGPKLSRTKQRDDAPVQIYAWAVMGDQALIRASSSLALFLTSDLKINGLALLFL